MDYGSEFTVKVGETELGKVNTKVENKKCTKDVLSEAIAEGYVDSVIYKESGPATITVTGSTGSQYLSRIWVTKYQEE